MESVASKQVDFEQFGITLTEELDAILAGSCTSGLQRAVAHTATAAESVCRDRPMACAAGCPHCCVLNVAVLLPEASAIADFLQRELAPPELADLKQRLSLHSSWVRWMDDEERIIRKAVCPLLDPTGKCTVHPVRPLACRGVASLDSNRCREAFNPIISDDDRLVPADLLRRAFYDEAFKQLARALKKHGFDDKSMDLVDGICSFLGQPDLMTTDPAHRFSD